MLRNEVDPPSPQTSHCNENSRLGAYETAGWASWALHARMRCRQAVPSGECASARQDVDSVLFITPSLNAKGRIRNSKGRVRSAVTTV